MSQVHTNIEGYELSWRELNEDLLQTLPVIAIKKVQDLHFFVKIVNRFFDCNNAVDVISYFLMNRETAHASTFRFIS